MNRYRHLPMYFEKLIGDKKHVLIAELGAGPVNTIGDHFRDVKVEIYASDIFADEYNKFWMKAMKTALVPILYQDMEHLTYPDNMFDIVHCVNALDHTPDARQAICEMKRVCKPGGWIYMRHAPNQKKRYGGMHAWNFSEKGLSNEKDAIFLPEFSTHLEDDLIVNIWQKI
jgi:ubiquinone/menaquinone biosynthesis C-methylase UbiE